MRHETLELGSYNNLAQHRMCSIFFKSLHPAVQHSYLRLKLQGHVIIDYAGKHVLNFVIEYLCENKKVSKTILACTMYNVQCTCGAKVEQKLLSNNLVTLSHKLLCSETLLPCVRTIPRVTLKNRVVPIYSFLYSGKCSLHTETYTNNSYNPSPRNLFIQA